MSYLDDLQSELAVDAHLDVMGDTVIRTPSGGTPVTLTGVWNEQQQSRDITVGERSVRAGILEIPAATPVARGDQWTIGGEVWVIHSDEWLGVINGGFRNIRLQRNDKSTTRENSRGII